MRDVMIVLISACAIAPEIASVPLVKLRFTGTRPAMSAAMLLSAPPTDAGIMIPTCSWPSVRVATT